MDGLEEKRRRSAFQEVGLDDAGGRQGARTTPVKKRERPHSVRFRSKDEVYTISRHEDEDAEDERLARAMNLTARPLGLSHTPLPDGSHSIMYRFGAFLLLLAGIFPLLQSLGMFSHGSIGIQGVNGGPIPRESKSGPMLGRRQDSPTDVCFRWAQQSALVNGTLYLYGGQATTESGQTQNTWNNNLLKLDLTKTWQIGTPTLEGLPQPSGPPEVALGYLFNDHDSLYLYGGQFSWKPPVSPVPFATWEYDLQDETWIEHSDPLTSGGNSAPSDGEAVERSSEGAGVNIPTLGRGYYFGGHQDGYTTEGWSQSIWRIYLQSMLEYTFPGYANDQVDSLGGGKTAGEAGVYRNITNGGLQANAGFTARADGILAYVPGFGDEGILLALAGGTNETFTQMNNVNVYDIATSSWYTQATAGETPDIRVNPCAVVAASQDGTSYNIYMWGGQNLIPAGNQTQFDDMWILSVPSFNWIRVDQSGQSVPYGRSGHTCNIWNGQLVSVGGYVGDQLTCESPGIYVFDLSALEWKQQYTALVSATDSESDDNASSSSGSSDKPGSGGSDNPFNQQPEQIADGDDPGGLYGSFGYEVPEAVYKVIGGGKTGGATITTPAATATAGPLATGSAQTYTVTRPNGSTVTETAAAGSGGGGTSSGSGNDGGPNIAAIVVGTVCGILLIVICYLLFCLYLYRKQLALYKNHVEMSQRQARGEKPPAIPGLWTTTSESAKSSSDRRRHEAQPFLAAGEGNSQSGSHAQSSGPSSGPGRSGGAAGQSAEQRTTTSSARSSTEDLLAGQEPTFVGVLLNPRRSLKVVNRD